MLKSRGFFISLKWFLISIVIALAITAMVISLTGGNAGQSLVALTVGAFGSVNGIWQTLAKATPLILAGLGVAIGLKCGLFNIGAEGQLLMGGLAAAWAGYSFNGLPWIIHIPIAMSAGALAGALWASVPGYLKAWRGAHEVIVTIMMNYLAIQLTHYLVNNPMRDRTSSVLGTPKVALSSQLPTLDANAICSVGLIIAIAIAAGVHLFLSRTATGFEIRSVGQNPEASNAAGVNIRMTIVKAMSLSGSLAGLAGAIEVLGVHHRFLDSFSPGYGFDSIAVALLGNSSAGGVVASSVLFGGISSGAIQMEIATDTPRQIAGVIQAIVIICAGAKYVRRQRST